MLNVYIIGSKFVARGAAKVLTTQPDVCLCGIVVDAAEDAAAFGQNAREARLYSTLESMLAQNDVRGSLVIVTTPPCDHFQKTREILARGGHVLCEKPLGISSQQALSLSAMATEARLVNACCESRFFGTKPVSLARAFLRENRLGDIYLVEQKGLSRLCRPGIEFEPNLHWYLNKDESGGGPIMDWGVYDIGVLHNIFGDIDSIEVKHARVVNGLAGIPPSLADGYSVEEHGYAVSEARRSSGKSFTLVHERAMVVHGEATSSLRICGRQGGLHLNWSGGAPSFAHYFYDERYGVAECRYEVDEPLDFDRFPIRNAIEAIRGEAEVAVSFADAHRHLRYIEDIYCVASWDGKREVSA